MPVRAGQSEPQGITAAYERTRDRFHYRFENPSSFDSSELVPHEFTQTYWGDNHWLVVRANFSVASHHFESEIAATPQRSTRADDYDTFFQPSGDVVIEGTTGGVSMRSWRIGQAVGVGRRAGVDWSLAYRYRSDRSNFHAGLKSTSHTQPRTREESWIDTRETTISRNFGPEIRITRAWRAPGSRMTLAAGIAPVANGRLTILLPDKYPGRTIVFNALYASVDPRLTVAIGRRWPVTLSAGYTRTFSYVRSRQFIRSAATIGVSIGWRSQR